MIEILITLVCLAAATALCYWLVNRVVVGPGLIPPSPVAATMQRAKGGDGVDFGGRKTRWSRMPN